MWVWLQGCWLVERGQLLGVYCRCRRTRRAVLAERARQAMAPSCAHTQRLLSLPEPLGWPALIASPCLALPRRCLAVSACQCAAHNWGCVFSTSTPLCELPTFFIYRPCCAVPPWFRRTSHMRAPARSRTGLTSPNKLTPLTLTEHMDTNCRDRRACTSESSRHPCTALAVPSHRGSGALAMLQVATVRRPSPGRYRRPKANLPPIAPHRTR